MRGKDPFWKYVEVEIENRRSRCKFCKKEIAGGNIRRIKHHLAGTIGEGVTICNQVPLNVREEAIIAIENSNKRARATVSTSSAASDVFSRGLSPYFSVTETGVAKNSNVANNKLARFIVFNNISLDVVETPFFVDFVKNVANCGPDYELPSSLELGMEFLPEVESYVKEVKESWETMGCSIMLDKWSKFINVMIYCAKGAIFLNSYEISEFLKDEILSKTIEETGVDRVLQVVTNDIEVFSYVRDILSSKYPKIYQISCVIHEIYSFLKAIDDVEWVKSIIDDATLLVEFVQENIRNLSLTKSRGLKHFCMSKFGSSYQMLQSILGSKDQLQEFVGKDWDLSDCIKNQRQMKIIDIIPSGNFWGQVQEVIKVMEPFVQVLCLVENDGSTSGYLYAAMEKARETIEEHNSIDKTEKFGKILKLFEERCNKIIHPIHAAAAFLNPDYMCNGKFKWNSEMNGGIDFVLKTLVSEEDKGKFTEEMLLYRNKGPKLFNDLANELMKSHHPRVWWNYCGDLPTLKKYAIQILSQTCKSSCHLKPSPFLFAQRKKMKMATSRPWDNLLYVTVNTMMMENFRTMEGKQDRRIDLEKFNEFPDYIDPKEGWEDDQIELFNGNSNNHAQDTTCSWCLNEKVFDKKPEKDVMNDRIEQDLALINTEVSGDEILRKLISFIQLQMCHAVQDTNTLQILQNIIYYIHQRQIENEGNMQMSTQNWQEPNTAGAGPSTSFEPFFEPFINGLSSGGLANNLNINGDRGNNKDYDEALPTREADATLGESTVPYSINHEHDDQLFYY